MNLFLKNRLFVCFIVSIMILAVFVPGVSSIQQNNISKNVFDKKMEHMSYDSNLPNPFVSITTSMGTIRVELFRDLVPNTVNHFIKLVDNKFYNDLVFHRVINDFVVQGGGYYPNGTLKQSPFGTIGLEINPNARHVDGAIAMARGSDPNSASTQFYICDGPQHNLDDNYAVFGKVTADSIGFIRDIAEVPTEPKYGHQDWPKNDVIIWDIVVLESALDIEVYVRGGLGGFTARVRNKGGSPYHHAVSVNISIFVGFPNPKYEFNLLTPPPLLDKKTVRLKTIKEQIMFGFRLISVNIEMDLNEDGAFDDFETRLGLLIGPFVIIRPARLKIT